MRTSAFLPFALTPRPSMRLDGLKSVSPAYRRLVDSKWVHERKQLQQMLYREHMHLKKESIALKKEADTWTSYPPFGGAFGAILN